MEIKINDTAYRLQSDYEITEQAGATAVMTVNIKLDNKREPQPFDMVTITEEERSRGGDLLTGNAVKDDTVLIDSTLTLDKEDYATYEGIIEQDKTYEELINGAQFNTSESLDYFRR